MMNKITAIEKIFYNLDSLTDELGDLPDTQQADKDFWEYMYTIIGNSSCNTKKKLGIEERLIVCKVMHEKQGFISGFRYAASLLMGVPYD